MSVRYDDSYPNDQFHPTDLIPEKPSTNRQVIGDDDMLQLTDELILSVTEKDLDEFDEMLDEFKVIQKE